MHVDIMPGAGDPANFVLPQQPFNPCLFPTYILADLLPTTQLSPPSTRLDLLLLDLLNRASRYATFSSVTNPYQCRVDGLLYVSHPRSRLLQLPSGSWLFVLTVSISPPPPLRTASSDTRDNPSMTSRSISIRARVPRPSRHHQQHINHGLVDVFRRCSRLTRWVVAVFRLQLTRSGSWRTR
jgi:hypothetical protein